MSDMARKQIAIRVDLDELKRLEALGRQMKPKPLTRSDMVNVAIAAYLSTNDAKAKGKK